MKRSYLIAPLIALLVFAAGYGLFQRDALLREQVRQTQQQAARKAQLAAETEARRQAVVESVRVQAERQKERDAREANERAQLEERQLAVIARDRVLAEKETLTRRLAGLKTELAAEQAALAQLSATRTAALAEQVFLKKFVDQAEANVKALADVIAKLQPADAARSAGTVEAPVKKKS